MIGRTSVVPDLIDALIDLWRSQSDLAGVKVTDGISTAYELGTYLMVGVDDPELTQWTSAEATQEWALATPTGRNESGSITCLVQAWSGDVTPGAARREAFRVFAAVQESLWTTGPTMTAQPDLVPAVFRSAFGVSALAVIGVWKAGVGAHRLIQAQNDEGALASIIFQLNFNARL